MATLQSGTNWIRFEQQTYFVHPGERGIDALLRGGAPVTFSCRKGSCRACMLQAVSGDPGQAARDRLPADLRAMGFFLPCCATEVHEVVAQRPDLSLCRHEAVVAEKIPIGPSAVRLRLEPMRALDWKAGQRIDLIGPGEALRPYSIASLPSDYFLDLDIRLHHGGVLSGWIAGELAVGDTVRFQGPSGAFHYDEALADRDLLLVGTGTGGGALLALARDALARGHRGTIRLYHGARSADGLYLSSELEALAQDPRARVTMAASREAAFGRAPARVVDLAFDGTDLSGQAVFLCGGPEMVEARRVAALRAGVALELIFSDPYEARHPAIPDDAATLRALGPEPELWAELEEGAKLTRILTDLYGRIFEDDRLAPFFHRVTKSRAIQKQYSFLRDVFSGTHDYFGEKPFNSHHWMIISDELFDYREDLFVRIAREHGLSEAGLRRWIAVHEAFRRAIVKLAPRGVIRAGQEHDLSGFSIEPIDVATLCDGCEGEIAAGEQVRMHRRTGELFCAKCQGAATPEPALA